jgi:hypothetical protein
MKPLRRTLLVCAITCLTAANDSYAQKRNGLDLTGTWEIHFQDDDGVSTTNPKLVLRQTGDKLTGTFGKFDWPVIGAVDKGHVVFSFVAFGHEGGKPISDTVFYWGAVDDKGKMSGRMKNPKEAGDWSAVKH